MADGAIVRTLRVLRALCETGPVPLKTLSEETGLAPPTLLRTLRLMADEGFVVQRPDRTWRATMVVWRLGCAVNSAIGIAGLAREHTDRLCQDLDETVVYAVLDQDSVTYAAHSEPTKPIRAHVRPGSSHGLLNVTTGRAVLAWLEREHVERALIAYRRSGGTGFSDLDEVERLLGDVRRQGFHQGRGLLWPDLWGAAAPVFDVSGQPVGALGVSIPHDRVEENGRSATAAIVREAAAMTRQLGGRIPGAPAS